MIAVFPNTTLADTANTDKIAKALDEDGAVIVERVAPPDLVDRVVAELRPHFDREGHRFQNEFNGYATLRLGGILALSPSSVELIAHALVLALADHVLKPNCESYRIGSCTGIEILPGEADQELHRDDDLYPVRIPEVDYQISAMWALDDFTVSNGATRVVPGSHDLRPIAGVPTGEIEQATMPRGSLLLYTGSLIHGGGANRGGDPRCGLINTYSLGWLRQEENQYLTIPREVADGFPESVRRLIGYQSHGPYLGVYPDDPDGNWFDA